MDKKTEQLIDEQIGRLPHELNIFATSPDWQRTLDEIIARYALTKDTATSIKFEVLLTLIGIANPDAFREELVKILFARAEVLDAIVAEVEAKIFVPIRPALIAFFESEQATAGVEKGGVTETIPQGTTPANIPTQATEPLIPTLIPRVILPANAEPVAPVIPLFEQKMQAGFIPAPQATVAPIEVTPQIITSAPRIPTPTQGTFSHDPYREPVE